MLEWRSRLPWFPCNKKIPRKNATALRGSRPLATTGATPERTTVLQTAGAEEKEEDKKPIIEETNETSAH